uniref:Uncharacterized protein n=1 Tax=Sphingomonas sp. JE1 TaxID=1628059 RepID=A0A0D4ZZX1_9SPHN|nr:hypothetical protein pJE1_133 [Sphingomonas sp. JE1]
MSGQGRRFSDGAFLFEYIFLPSAPADPTKFGWPSRRYPPFIEEDLVPLPADGGRRKYPDLVTAGYAKVIRQLRIQEVTYALAKHIKIILRHVHPFSSKYETILRYI